MKQGLKILMLAACPFPANYGSPASIREMSETLAEMGHTVHILTYPFGLELPVNKPIVHRIPDLGLKKTITVGPTSQKPILDLQMVWHAVKLVRRHNCDVIHAHNYEGALIGILTKWFTGKPLLYNAVNTMMDELPTYKFFKPAILAKFLGWFLDRFVPIWPDHITTVSAELKHNLEKLGHPASKLTVVPAGVLPEMFDQADPLKMRQKLGLEGKKIVLYTGTIDPFQRLDYLMEAFARVIPHIPEAVLVVVCPFPQEALITELDALASRLNIRAQVVWIRSHPLSDLPDYLAMADVAVAPRPNCPGHPVKLLNYMCSALPIVVSEGAAKGIVHLDNGWVNRDHDVDSMSEGILRLLEDRPLAVKLAESAKQTIYREFAWKSLCLKIELIYCTIACESMKKVDRVTE